MRKGKKSQFNMMVGAPALWGVGIKKKKKRRKEKSEIKIVVSDKYFHYSCPDVAALFPQHDRGQNK